MREFLVAVCPIAIWCIVAGEAVIAALLFIHAAKKKSKIAFWSGILTLGLILDAAIIGLGSVLPPETLAAVSPARASDPAAVPDLRVCAEPEKAGHDRRVDRDGSYHGGGRRAGICNQARIGNDCKRHTPEGGRRHAEMGGNDQHGAVVRHGHSDDDRRDHCVDQGEDAASVPLGIPDVCVLRARSGDRQHRSDLFHQHVRRDFDGPVPVSLCTRKNKTPPV